MPDPQCPAPPSPQIIAPHPPPFAPSAPPLPAAKTVLPTRDNVPWKARALASASIRKSPKNAPGRVSNLRRRCRLLRPNIPPQSPPLRPRSIRQVSAANPKDYSSARKEHCPSHKPSKIPAHLYFPAESPQPRAIASPVSHLPQERSRDANGSHTRKATPPHLHNSSQKSARRAKTQANQNAHATPAQPQPPQSPPAHALHPRPHTQTHSTADPAAHSIPQSAPNARPLTPQAKPPVHEPAQPSPRPKENSSHS